MADSNQKILHTYLFVFLGIAFIDLCLQILSFFALRSDLWGFHFYSFFNPVFIILSSGLIILATIKLLLTIQPQDSPERETNAIGKHSVATAIGFAVLCGVIFWLLRSRQLFLGDALPLTLSLPDGLEIHPRQPLSMWLNHLMFEYIGPMIKGEGMADADVAQQVVSMGSVIAGVLYALVAVALGRLLVSETRHPSRTAWFITIILLSQGFVQLFFGYVENYTYYALAIGIYLYTSLLFLKGESRLLLPALVLILAITLHLSSAVLFPSFLVLAVFALTSRKRRRASLIDLAICASVSFAIHMMLIRYWEYNLPSSLLDVSILALGQGEEFIPGYLMSWRHLSDFLNEQFLIGPFALFAFLATAFIAFRTQGRRSVSTNFLLVVGLTYFAVSLIANDSNLGYARNWDLIAPAGICFTTAAMYFLLRHVPPSQARISSLLVFACTVSILHTAPWVWTNHNESLALERFKTLPLGLGRTETVVANWYLRNEKPAEAARWLKSALKNNPNNGPAYAFLGMILTEQNRFEEAREVYSRAVKLRSDKLGYRNNYMMTLLKLGRNEEALEQFEILTSMKPEAEKYWRGMVEVLTRLERSGENVRIYENSLHLNELKLRSEPDDKITGVKLCAYLLLLGREDEALLVYRRALKTNLNNGPAYFFLGLNFTYAARLEEAREVYSEAVRLRPDIQYYRETYMMNLLELGRDEEALKQLERLTSMNPESGKYWELMAEVLTRLGRTGETVRIYEKLLRFSEERLELEPGNETANIKAGIYLMLLDREDEALLNFHQALRSNPLSLSGLFNIGSALVKMGRTEEAKPFLHRFVELYPDHPKTVWARQHLE